MERLRQMVEKLFRLPLDRRWLWVLLLVNLVGAGYGFCWYREQLAVTPLGYWPVVPDSPLSVLFMSMVISLLLAGRRSELLEAVAYISLAKYGAWTVFVIAMYWMKGGRVVFEDVHLVVSHGAMVAQAVVFARQFVPRPVPVLAAGAWFALNDYFDYWVGVHPTLPDPSYFAVVKFQAVAATVFAGGALLAWSLARRVGRRRRWERNAPC